MVISETERPSGFWSYVHADDAAERGRILRLCERVKEEFGLLTGEDLELFTDRTHISWGNKWRETLNDALTETTFLIAIVTPRFVRSRECRNEVLRFSQNAKARGVPELLLPILYTPSVDGLVEDSDDEVMAALARTQWKPFGPLRLLDEEGEPYNIAVSELAQRLIEITNEVASKPEAIPLSSADEEGADEFGEDDAPGLLDANAAIDTLLPEWRTTIDKLGELMRAMTEVTERHTPLVEKAAKKGAPAQLFAARQYAIELTPVAEEFLATGQRYAEQAVEVDTNVLVILRDIAARPSEERKSGSSQIMVNAIRELLHEGAEATASVGAFRSSVRGLAKLSKDVRRPVALIDKGVVAFFDGQRIIEAWGREIDGAEA